MTDGAVNWVERAIEQVNRLALALLYNTGALTKCPLDGTVIRVGDDDAEHRAYERGSATLRDLGAEELGNVLISAIRRELEQADYGACPECAVLAASRCALH